MRISARLLAVSAIVALGTACASFTPKESIKDPAAFSNIQTLQKELSTTHSEQLIVQTELLRDLLARDRSQQKQCQKESKDLHGKLEAIKSIDLNGAQL